MSDNEQKPNKRVISPEHKAKMMAAAAEARARKKAAQANAVTPTADAAAPVTETPKKEKKEPRVPKKEKKVSGAGIEETTTSEAETNVKETPAADTPKKEKKAAGSKKEKKVEETATENKTTWQPIISLVFNMKNDNYEEDGSAGEEWMQDRTYFASEDALRRYLTDRINNWTDEFSTMIRGIADDSPTQIAKIIDHIVAMPFLTNHPLCPEFNICRFSAPLHQ